MTSRFMAGTGLGLLLVTAGCPECAPERVGEGVARLTVRNVAGMVSLINNNEECGFASPAVQRAPVMEGEPGTPGSITFRVNDCAIDLGDDRIITEDCNGVVTRGRGRVTLTATRTIEGTLTGNAQNPIVPADPDAVTITIEEARFEDFEVIRSNDPDRLRMVEGTLSAVARPLLAVSQSTGACAIATPNISFSDIRYGESTVSVHTEDREFEADVEESDITAQSGRRGDLENAVRGTMTVFGNDVDVTGDQELDDQYERNTFVESYSCLPDIAEPVSFQCIEFESRLGDAAARLGISALGALSAFLDAETSCGFSSPAVARAAVVEGTPGGEGTLTLTVTDCAIDLAEPVTLPADCTGNARTLEGSAVITATRVVEGYITGDPTAPIIPLSSQPATFDLIADLQGFRVANTQNANAILVEQGTLSGVVQPKLFVGSATGACTVTSPNADFSNVRWEDAALVVSSDAGSFDVSVERAQLEGTSGVTVNGTNALRGAITIGGEDIAVNNDGRGLDPGFDAETFDESWQCGRALAQPISDQCEAAALGLLGGGVAALTMRDLGVIVRVVEGNEECGFSSAAVAGNASMDEAAGGLASLSLALPAGGCTIALPANTVVFRDCLGNAVEMSGTIVVTGTKIVVGVPTGDLLAPVLPVSTDAVRYDLDIDFDEVTIESSAFADALIVHEGRLSAIVEPRLALDPATDRCTIPTPILTFTDVTWTDADVTLVTEVAGEPLTSRILVESTDLDAQAGTGVDGTNELSGTVRVLGQRVRLDGPLDPEFEAEAFSSTWNCAANGSPVLATDEQCLAGASTDPGTVD